MWWAVDKPDYKKHIIRDYFKEFKVDEYDEFNKNNILHWLNKIPDDVIIEAVCESESIAGSCCDEKIVICLRPYKSREETDKEYKRRIEREEKEYNEYLKQEKDDQYKKDLEEYNRIKEKYNLY